MSREYDYLFKLVIVGNSGVGKSSILLRYADDMFNETYLTTIGVDFKFRTIQVDGKKVKMQIWDTAGQERFRTITSAYYKGADAIVLVYDTTSAVTFTDIDRFWINEVESYAEKDVNLLLLGNKSDLIDQKKIDSNQGREYALKKGMEFHEVSAKTADKISEAFSNIAKKLMEKKDAKNRERKASRNANRGNVPNASSGTTTVNTSTTAPVQKRDIFGSTTTTSSFNSTDSSMTGPTTSYSAVTIKNLQPVYRDQDNKENPTLASKFNSCCQ